MNFFVPREMVEKLERRVCVLRTTFANRLSRVSAKITIVPKFKASRQPSRLRGPLKIVKLLIPRLTIATALRFFVADHERVMHKFSRMHRRRKYTLQTYLN